MRPETQQNRPSTTALRQLGPQCRRCRNTEARCAYLSICCPDCTHWRNYDRNGEPVSDREHATERGWQQHRYRREVPCVACIHAHREHNSERKRTA